MSSSVTSSGHHNQIYLRFKRHKQTVFVQCNTNQLLQTVKERLAELQGKDEDDLQLYEYLSTDRRTTIGNEIIERQKEQAKLQKKKDKFPGQTEIKIDTLDTVQFPPLDCNKKLWELGLDNDQIVFFVYRLTDYENNWETIDVPGLYTEKPKQNNNNNTQQTNNANNTNNVNNNATTNNSNNNSPPPAK